MVQPLVVMNEQTFNLGLRLAEVEIHTRTIGIS